MGYRSTTCVPQYPLASHKFKESIPAPQSGLGPVMVSIEKRRWSESAFTVHGAKPMVLALLKAVPPATKGGAVALTMLVMSSVVSGPVAFNPNAAGS